MQTQFCKACERQEECMKAQFCRYPKIGNPETEGEATAAELFRFAMKQLD